MGHENNSFGAMLAGILDGGKGADDTLVIGDFLVAVQRDIEVHLDIGRLAVGSGHKYKLCSTTGRWLHTRIRTRLPLRSTSVIASLSESDIFDKIWLDI